MESIIDDLNFRDGKETEPSSPGMEPVCNGRRRESDGISAEVSEDAIQNEKWEICRGGKVTGKSRNWKFLTFIIPKINVRQCC